MVAAANLVEVAALVGDTARATMLNALMGGQSLTATELAYCANVSRATASGHLSKLVAARADMRFYEYTAFCNGPGDVKFPRVIVTPPSSRFCPWSAPRPPHYAVRRNGEPI